MKKIFLILLIAFITAVLGSCTHTQTKESSDSDKIFEDLAASLSKAEKRLPNKTIAVYGFEMIGKKNNSYAMFSTEKLTHKLVSIGNLMVIERSRIDQILKEQSLSMSGALDAGTAAKIGKILAVDAVIIGTIHATKNQVEFIARVIQSEKGIILASANEKMITETSPEDEKLTAEKTSEEKIKTTETVEKVITDNKANLNAVLKPYKRVFRSDEQVTISYSGLPGNQNDWITLTKASASDTTYGDWFYTYGQRSGTYSFKVTEPGDYEVRVYYNWPKGGYIVQKRASIKVQ